jgi:hypothetical protein
VVEAQNLQNGDKMMKCDYPVIDGTQKMLYPYTHGFFCGDGTCTQTEEKSHDESNTQNVQCKNNKIPVSLLYADKKKLHESGSCEPKQAKKRCDNGTRKNKKAGNCDPRHARVQSNKSTTIKQRTPTPSPIKQRTPTPSPVNKNSYSFTGKTKNSYSFTDKTKNSFSSTDESSIYQRFGETGYLSSIMLNLSPISTSGINKGIFCIKS